MKEFLINGQTLRIDVIDWEDNYQGFVEFESIKLINQNYYCSYKKSHYEKIDGNSPSMLDNNKNMYVTCEDRTIRIKLREFLGLKKFLLRAELGAQDNDLARFELHDDIPTEDEECYGKRMWQAALRLLFYHKKISKSEMKKYIDKWRYF